MGIWVTIGLLYLAIDLSASHKKLDVLNNDALVLMVLVLALVLYMFAWPACIAFDVYKWNKEKTNATSN